MARRLYKTGDRKVKLTRGYIGSIPTPSAGHTLVWDTEIRGFAVVVSPKGRATFILKHRTRAGVQRKPTVGVLGDVTLDQARSNARAILAAVWAGGDPIGARHRDRGAPTVADLCRDYIARHVEVHLKPSTQKKVRSYVTRHILPALGAKRARDVEWEDVARLHRSMAGTPIEANRTLETLSKMFELARRWGYRDGENPARGHDTYPERRVHHHISEIGLARLSVALKEHEARFPQGVAIVRVALFTGFRLSEVCGLRWSEIDTDHGLAHLRDTKTGQSSRPVSQVALDIIANQPRLRGSDFVFPSPTKPGRPRSDINHEWRLIKAASGLSALRFHDLRHAFAEQAATGGLSLPMVGRLLGHRSSATTQRYAVLADDPARQATEMVGRRLTVAMSGTK